MSDDERYPVEILKTKTVDELIEIIFSLDGLGLLGYEATLTHDYPIVFGSLYIFTLLSLMVNIITDLCYCLVDKRISFEALS